MKKNSSPGGMSAGVDAVGINEVCHRVQRDQEHIRASLESPRKTKSKKHVEK